MLSLFRFNADANPCSEPESCINSNCIYNINDLNGKGLQCNETGASCYCFDTNYYYFNLNTCKPIQFQNNLDIFIQYTCLDTTAMTLNDNKQCVCQPGYYMVNGNEYTNNPLEATGCNVCSNAETGGMTCTCAGGVAPPDCKYAITLNLNDGTGNLNNTSHCTGNSCNCPIEEPCLFPSFNGEAPSGYTFDGWNTQPNGSGNNYNLSGDVESGGTLYARWKKSITFRKNYNTDNDVHSTEYCYYNGNLNFPNSFPTSPTNFYIEGGLIDQKWYTNNNGTGTSYTHGGSNIFCNNVIVSELFPKWLYEVKYDKNCPPSTSSFLDITSTCVKNASCELASVPLNMTCAGGWILDTEHWYQNSNGTGTQYASGTTVDAPAFSDDGNTTLYAKWIQCSDGTYYNNGVCTDCPNGYYCPSGATTPTACPAGYTSPASSPAKSACYITTGAGENNTKFCEDNGARCFYLPDVGNIHWGPPQP